jgi:uncharacterized protein YndB with AHSA1/START domain
MRAKPQYIPSMSDEAVKAKTGRAWDQWFKRLDKDGAQCMVHTAIAELLSEKHGVGDWWAQMVAVEYERARGLRAVNQKSDGFSVSVSRTITASTAVLFDATHDGVKRRRWFPKGRFTITSATPRKSVRIKSDDGTRVEIAFYEKLGGKAQVTIQHNKLSNAAAVESARAQWKTALDNLRNVIAL